MAKNAPYISFGLELKKLRAEANKTLTDMSGAVEYELDYLKRIEAGEMRPSEEFIVLMINLFNLNDGEADNLWKLAGYDADPKLDKDLGLTQGPIPIIIPLNDSRIVYTDTVNVTANNFGVVINFMQGIGAGNQNMAVSRVGMSLDHAVSFMKMMSDTIEKVVDHKQGKPDKKRSSNTPGDKDNSSIRSSDESTDSATPESSQG